MTAILLPSGTSHPEPERECTDPHCRYLTSSFSLTPSRTLFAFRLDPLNDSGRRCPGAAPACSGRTGNPGLRTLARATCCPSGRNRRCTFRSTVVLCRTRGRRSSAWTSPPRCRRPMASATGGGPRTHNPAVVETPALPVAARCLPGRTCLSGEESRRGQDAAMGLKNQGTFPSCVTSKQQAPDRQLAGGPNPGVFRQPWGECECLV